MNAKTLPRVTVVDDKRVVVRIASDTPANRAAARKIAAKAAGTPILRALISAEPRKGDTVDLTWFPQFRARKVTSAVPTARELGIETTAPDTGGDRMAWLEREVARLSALVGETPATVPSAPKSERVNPFRKPAPACKTCEDTGAIRGAGPRAGEAYRTANGASQSPTAVACKHNATSAKRAAALKAARAA